MTRRFSVLVLLALVCAASFAGAQQTGPLDEDVMTVLGRPEGSPPPSGVVAPRSSEIDRKLRCPVCQGVSIADSPSGMATKMREQVRNLVSAGYSDEQVLSYFEHSYGEFVRLEPPMRGLNWLLWAMPGLLLFFGAFALFMRARRPGAITMTTPGDSPAPLQSAVIDPAMEKYLERIRRDSGQSS